MEMHKNGLGWNPNGQYCGICDADSCEQCATRFVYSIEDTQLYNVLVVDNYVFDCIDAVKDYEEIIENDSDKLDELIRKIDDFIWQFIRSSIKTDYNESFMFELMEFIDFIYNSYDKDIEYYDLEKSYEEVEYIFKDPATGKLYRLSGYWTPWDGFEPNNYNFEEVESYEKTIIKYRKVEK